MILSLSNKKLIRSLALKKNRQKEGLMVMEGAKSIEEAVTKAPGLIEYIVINESLPIPESILVRGIDVAQISQEELNKLSTLSTNQYGLVVLQQPTLPIDSSRNLIYLHELRDPGNFGTIIRVANWFGLGGVLYSPGTVDPYNAKVIQASMGSILEVPIEAIDIASAKTTYAKQWLATVMDGKSIETYLTEQNGDWPPSVLMIGSESHGLPEALTLAADEQLSIPQSSQNNAESLNAAIAAGIFGYFMRTR